jgi:hypothetical protein
VAARRHRGALFEVNLGESERKGVLNTNAPVFGCIPAGHVTAMTCWECVSLRENYAFRPWKSLASTEHTLRDAVSQLRSNQDFKSEANSR